jgi:hypothetical protein
MNPARKILASGATAVVLIAGHAVAAEAPKDEARVTQIIRDVNLLPTGATPRPAIVNDQVRQDTGVRTGEESRTELTFVDLTITRLGANTIFSFNKAGRNGQLDSGSILLRVPKNSGGAEFRTHTVTVGITGTTVIFESTRLGNSKLIVLEGRARLTLVKHPGESAKVRAGQVLDVKAGALKLSVPVNVDLDQIMKTHPLITDFPPLPSENLIRNVIKNQPPPATSGPAPAIAGAPPGSQVQPVTTTGPAPPPTQINTPIPTPPPKRGRTPRPISNPVSTGQPPPPQGNTPKPIRSPKPTSTPKSNPIRTPRPTPKPVSSPTPTPPQIFRRVPSQSIGPSTGNPSRAVKTFKKINPTPTPPIIR